METIFLPMDKIMGAEIVGKQNSLEMLRCLAAQRQLYSSAKTLFFLYLIFSTIVVVFLSLFNLYKNISWVMAAYGSVVAIIDVAFLSSSIKNKKEKAAKIQELFDTNVLNINWNDVLVEQKPISEEIFRYSEKYKKRHQNFNSLENWYSTKINDINTDVTKIICQRSNCTYDYAIRESFSNTILIILIITSLLLLLIGFIKGLTLQNFFLLVIFPILPAIILLIRTIKENNSSKKALDNLRSIMESIWKQIISGDRININQKAREIQDKIFLNRKSSPLIFDWYYLKKREQLENEMNFTVDNMVQEYQNKKNT